MSDKETGAIEGKDNKYDCANIKKFTPKKKWVMTKDKWQTEKS
jgi:hypothetical protein